MATSSIFHHFVIKGEENVKSFIDAMDKSMYLQERAEKHPELAHAPIDEEDFAKWVEKVDANGYEW